jgi:type III restriction enzyme
VPASSTTRTGGLAVLPRLERQRDERFHASADRRQGIDFLRVEPYDRWAVKLATGAGKTLVMAMAIIWSGLNKVANRQDTRFADAFLIVCPNLTVRERLSGAEGLVPAHPASAYRAFDLVPPNLSGAFGQLRVMVTNWHALAERQDPRRSVQRLGPEGDVAFCRRVLRDLGEASDHGPER